MKVAASMHSIRMLPHFLILLLILGDVLSVAPGDEHAECEVPDYPPRVRVLLDSWRYQTLLAPSSSDMGMGPSTNLPVWLTDADLKQTSSTSDTWYPAGGSCETGQVTAVCPLVRGDRWLFTQYIRKSVPASVAHAVRVFVNITYNFMECLQRTNCNSDLEVFKYVTNSEDSQDRVNMDEYADSIQPDNRIQNKDTTASGTANLYFNLRPMERGFYLALQIRQHGTCMEISRLLVYLRVCPAVMAGLVRYPATHAPVSGSVSVLGVCTENAHHSKTSQPDSLRCSSEGQWFNDQTHCECNEGYFRDGDMCRAYIRPVREHYTVPEEQQYVDVCFELASIKSILLSFNVSTRDNTAIASVDYVPLSTTITVSLSGGESQSTVVRCVGILIVVNDSLRETEKNFTVVAVNGSQVFSEVIVNIESSRANSCCSEGSVTVALGSILVLPTSTVSETTLYSASTNNVQQSLSLTTVPSSTRTNGSASSSSVVRTTLGAVGAAVAVAVIAVVVVVVSLVVFQRKRKRGHKQIDMVTAVSLTPDGIYENIARRQENSHDSIHELDNPLYDDARTLPILSNSSMFDDPIYDLTTPSESNPVELQLSNRDASQQPLPRDAIPVRDSTAPHDYEEAIPIKYSNRHLQPPNVQASESVAVVPEAVQPITTTPPVLEHEQMRDIPPAAIPTLEHEDIEMAESLTTTEGNGEEREGGTYGDDV